MPVGRRPGVCLSGPAVRATHTGPHTSPKHGQREGSCSWPRIPGCLGTAQPGAPDMHGCADDGAGREGQPSVNTRAPEQRGRARLCWGQWWSGVGSRGAPWAAGPPGPLLPMPAASGQPQRGWSGRATRFVLVPAASSLPRSALPTGDSYTTRCPPLSPSSRSLFGGKIDSRMIAH